jgi:hypothetical protein
MESLAKAALLIVHDHFGDFTDPAFYQKANMAPAKDFV